MNNVWKWLFLLGTMLFLFGCSDDDENSDSPPKTLQTVPAAGAKDVPSSTIISVTFDKELDPDTAADALNLDNGMTGTVNYDPDQKTLSFTSDFNLDFNTVYTATLEAGIADLDGNTTDESYSWTFTTAAAPDITSPDVQSTAPSDEAVDVPLNTAITVHFTEAVDPPALVDGIQLSDGSSDIDGTVTVNGSAATFQPDSSLAGETLYTATVSGDAADLAGNLLGDDYVWSFTTGPEPDVTPPAVENHSPADEATDVLADASVSVTFTESVDPSTVDSSTFMVESGENEITGSLSVNGSEVVFDPGAALAPESAYSVTLTTGITDLSGNPLGESLSWTFTTAAAVVGPAWGPPVRISAEGANTRSYNQYKDERAILKMDDSGNGLVVWQQSGTSGDEIWASHYTVSGGTGAWGAPVLISQSGVESGYPTLSVNGAGQAVVVWTHYSSIEDKIFLYSRFYQPGTGWGDILPLNTVGSLPRVVLDDDGIATVGWERGKSYPADPRYGRIKTAGSNRYIPGSGWEAEVLLEDLDFSDYYSNVGPPTLALGPGGAVHAVWRRELGDTSSLRHSVHSTTGWSNSTSIYNTPQYMRPFSAVETDGLGNVMVAFLENTDSAPRLLQIIRFEPLSGWGTPYVITEAPDLPDPDFAMDESGRALIAWREINESSREDILSSIFTPGEGWSEAELVETFDFFTAKNWSGTDIPADPSIAVLGGGDFMVAWHQRGEFTNSSVYTNRYSAGQGWGAPEVFRDESSIASGWPILAADPDGNALMVWGQNDGETWAADYR